MISIKSYAVNKKQQGNTVNSTTVVSGGFTQPDDTKVQGVNIWGQFHDHTADIEGDMSNVGNISSDGNISTSKDITAYNISATKNVNGDTANFTYGNIDYVDSKEINTQDLNADNANIDDLISTNISTDFLTVTKQAHFFELVIDKIKAAGGAVLLTPADGFKVDKVEDAGVIEVDEIIYDDENDQIFNVLRSPRFEFSGTTLGNNYLAMLTTSCHNLKYFYSTGYNQRRRLLYADGTVCANTYGNQNDHFVSPYILCDDITTITFENDGQPGSSGAKLCAYDENLNYIQSNSIGNQQTFTWTKATGTKWIRFSGRGASSFANGKIYINGQTSGDITIKYLYTSTKALNANSIKHFRIYVDETNTIYKEADDLVLDAMPVKLADGSCSLFDIVNTTQPTWTGSIANYTYGEETSGGYRSISGKKLYFRSNDGDRAIKNMWQVDDQALCQSFNEAQVGTTQQVSNKYYWALVTGVGTNIIDGDEYHYIILSNTVYVGTLDPEEGDEIAMLGNRSNDPNDDARKSAIYISAYDSIDQGIKAPLFAQYENINDFNLSAHRTSVISHDLNHFVGNFETINGDNIEQLIDDVSQGAVTYMHQAWANSYDGQIGFSKTYFNNALYVGFCSNHTLSDDSLTYRDYVWARLRGQDGTTPDVFKCDSDIQFINVKNNESDTPDFYVRGYQLVNGVYEEVNNPITCVYKYDGSPDYIDTDTSPYQVFPDRMGQDFENGLQSLYFELWDEWDDNIVATYNLGIIRDGSDGANGADADLYKMVPISEQIAIDANSTVGVNLVYNIIRVLGESYSLIPATDSGFKITFTAEYADNTSGTFSLSTGTTTPTYTNLSFQTNWKTNPKQLRKIIVELKNGSVVYDKRILYPVLTPAATFTITDNITSTVQGHTETISGIQNNISQIVQNADSIDARVTQIEGDYITESELRQTATEIEMRVQNTGVNIQEGTITLNSENTNVIGNLNLFDPEQGLVIYDEYKNPRVAIQNRTLGTLPNFDFGAEQFVSSDKIYNKTTAAQQYSVTFDTIDLGNYNAGQNIKLHKMYLMCRHMETSTNYISSVNYTVSIRRDNTQIYTTSNTATLEDARTGTYSFNDINVAISTNGTYKLVLTITAALSDNAVTGQFFNRFTGYSEKKMTQINIVGIDGAVFAESPTHYNWFGSDRTEFRDGNSFMRIMDGKIQRNTTRTQSGISGMSDISSTMPFHIVGMQQNYTATADDGFIVFGTQYGANRTLYLPYPSDLPGKWFFVKNTTNDKLIIRCNGHIVKDEEGTPVDYVETNKQAQIYVSDSIHWYRFWCV